MATNVDRLRAIALALPETHEEITWGTDITFRVRTKIFCTPADGNRFNGSLDQLRSLGKPGELPPDDPYAPWAGLVGSGILELMAQDGTTPAVSRSTFMPLGVNPADSEQCLGANGTIYVWSLMLSQGFRYPSL